MKKDPAASDKDKGKVICLPFDVVMKDERE